MRSIADKYLLNLTIPGLEFQKYIEKRVSHVLSNLDDQHSFEAFATFKHTFFELLSKF